MIWQVLRMASRGHGDGAGATSAASRCAPAPIPTSRREPHPARALPRRVGAGLGARVGPMRLQSQAGNDVCAHIDGLVSSCVAGTRRSMPLHRAARVITRIPHQLYMFRSHTVDAPAWLVCAGL